MIYRRCACVDERGKRYGNLPDKPTTAQTARACPQLLSDRKHGRWGYYLSRGVDAAGRRLQTREGNFATRRDAQRALAEAAAKHHRGEYVEPSKITLREYLDEWLPRRTNTGTGLKPSTVANYRRYIVQDIAPSQLGRMKLTNIRRSHVRDFTSTLDGRGARTVQAIVRLLSTALSDAVSDEIIGANPAARAPVPRVSTREFNPWEPAQVGAFLDEAAQHRIGAVFELAAFTGLRRAELAGLRWIDVDLATRQLTVRHTLVQADAVVVAGSPKTAAGRRVVQLDDAAVGTLVAWKLVQAAERDAWGDAWTDSGYVFTYESGESLKPPYLTRQFERLRERAGLPKMTLHGLRHEHASLLLASGADIALVSKRLGHSSIGITSDVYSHLIGDRARLAAENASALIPRTIAQRVHNVDAEDQKAPVPQ